MKLKTTFTTICLSLILVQIVSTSSLLTEQATTSEKRIHLLPGQSWTFIEESNLNESRETDYLWESELTVQGVEVTEEQLITMQALGLTERSEYFETLNYFEGLADTGRTNTGEAGEIFFIFFNPQVDVSTLEITYTYRSSNLQPWVIGLVVTIGVVIFLGISIYFTAKLRQKMLKEAMGEEEKSPAERYLEM